MKFVEVAALVELAGSSCSEPCGIRMLVVKKSILGGGDVEQVTQISKHILVFAFKIFSLNSSQLSLFNIANAYLLIDIVLASFYFDFHNYPSC